MKIISWNVNGVRAMVRKNGLNFLEKTDADIICLQETKCNKQDLAMDGYYSYWNYAEKKGYSGTAIFTKAQPLNVTYELKEKIFDEGRIIIAEYETFYLINAYFPNSGNKLDRIDYRLEWDKYFTTFVKKLKKPVITCGDFNISQTILDIAEPKKHIHHPGYTERERSSFSNIIKCGLVDAYRYLNEDTVQYTFWSYLGSNRTRNIGYRCDLFCVSDRIKNNIEKSKMYPDITASDHCPIVLKIDV